MIKDNKIKKIAIYKDFDILFKLYKILIVTLAGVTIAMLTGENAIFYKAKKSEEETRKQTATEILNLKITNTQMAT